jgi:hypothetical protein
VLTSPFYRSGAGRGSDPVSQYPVAAMGLHSAGYRSLRGTGRGGSGAGISRRAGGCLSQLRVTWEGRGARRHSAARSAEDRLR